MEPPVIYSSGSKRDPKVIRYYNVTVCIAATYRESRRPAIPEAHLKVLACQSSLSVTAANLDEERCEALGLIDVVYHCTYRAVQKFFVSFDQIYSKKSNH